MIEEKKVLTRHADSPGMIDVKNYIKDNGYKGLEKALEKKPLDIVEEVKKSFLRGRGGAGFPTGFKWSFIPTDKTKPHYLICNADEGEPGTFKDRVIMENDPFLLIEGMTIAAYALQADLGFIYIRGEFKWIAEILERAIQDARKVNMLGENIMDKGFDFDLIVMRGAGAYICGEETALIESIEGKRGQPRIKPPFPANSGLYGCPTIVNNVETLASIPFIAEHGAETYKLMGGFQAAGTKLYGISGHVNRPGVYEYPLGTNLKDLIQYAAGGVRNDKKLKAVIPGGLSATILKEDEIDIPMDFDSCVKADTMLGSGGVIVMDEDTPIPEIALATINFYVHESCGQCTPCREGLAKIQQILKILLAGNGTIQDIDTIIKLANTIDGTTLCPLGEAGGAVIRAMIKKFRSEFDALVS
ncbi:MAG: NADH-quinone oxidoreductase subunit NuoF [candidate division KSB1 bacterium]|jgi:NADH-quinone oxidoreductase F subunit|nr:NADH-quinone oxidoreductase subunit NuoF [candidate division KSB1 bacterium]